MAQSTLLILAPHNSYRIAPFLTAAQQLGVEPLLISEGKYALINARVAGIQVDFSQPEVALQQIFAYAKNFAIHGVIATDDATVELAALVAANFDLPHNATHSARYARRKDLARQRLQKAAVPVPKHAVINLHKPLAEQWPHGYPCVIKPLSMSASRGVIRVDNATDLVAAVARIVPMLQDLTDHFEQIHLLLEEYIDGDEYAVEGVLINGSLQVLALFDKPEPLRGPFFEESYYVTPSRLSQSKQARLIAVVDQACHAFGLCEGPIHAELRMDVHGQPWMLEVAARSIGGECARMLRFVLGESLESVVIANQLRRPITPSTATASGTGAGVLMIPIKEKGVLRRVEGIMVAKKIEFIEDVTISVREGYELIPLPEGSSYLGFIFAHAPTAAQAEAALRQAYACLNVVVAPVFDVQMR